MTAQISVENNLNGRDGTVVTRPISDITEDAIGFGISSFRVDYTIDYLHEVNGVTDAQLGFSSQMFAVASLEITRDSTADVNGFHDIGYFYRSTGSRLQSSGAPHFLSGQTWISGTHSIVPSAVPEPSSFILCGLILLGCFGSTKIAWPAAS